MKFRRFIILFYLSLIACGAIVTCAGRARADSAQNLADATRDLLIIADFCRDAIGPGTYQLERNLAINDLARRTGSEEWAIRFVEKFHQMVQRHPLERPADREKCLFHIEEKRFLLRVAKARYL